MVARFWMWLLLTAVYNFGNYGAGRMVTLLRLINLLPNQPATLSGYKAAWVVGGIIATILLTAANAFFTVGLYRAALKQVRGEHFNLVDLFHGKNTVRAMMANTVYQLAVVLSATALLLPAFVIAGLGILTVPIALEQGEGVVNAFKQSWEILKKNWWAATLFTLIAGLMSASGMIIFYLGVFLTTPLLYLSVALLHRNCFGVTQTSDGITIDMPLPPESAYDNR